MSSHDSPYGESSQHGNYASSDHAQGPARKKMRKGTKSCIECRRRKIKCTFEPGRPAVCNECFARGSTCVDQEHADVQVLAPAAPSNDASSLRERVSNLEDLVKQVLHRLPEKDTPQTTVHEASSVDAQAAEVLKSLASPTRGVRVDGDESLYFPENTRDSIPALALFDNAVFATKPMDKSPAILREQYNKSKTIISVLLKLLLPISDLEKILARSQEWWTIWKSMFPEITDRRCATMKEAVSHTLRSEKPAEVGKIMVCIALGIHQLPVDFDWSQISARESPSEVMERYISTIDRLIVQDEEIAATVDGIECMVLMSKWHINMGRPRKSWLLYRRAIAFAQLLGMHRLALATPTKTDAHAQRQLMIWVHLVMGDRYLSLMLGLPYTISEQFSAPALDLARRSQKEGSGEVYLTNMAPLIARLVDRNQNHAGTPYSVTMAMEHELEEMRSSRDRSWWTDQRLPGSSIEEHFERLQAQFFHHQYRVLLHMPFMLRSSADRRYQYSHTATLESSREMIKSYEALRDAETIGPYACKMVDFQAFTAAMLLLLNLCGYSQQTRGALSQQPDLDQDQQDSALIDRILHLLKAAAQEAGGAVAANSAQALEFLAKVREGCDEKSCPKSAQVAIPYFGTISITAGKQFVPIKAGTYPDAGRTVPQRMPSVTGLPTPPSLASSSCQPSPRDSLLSASDAASNRPSPYWHANSSDQIQQQVRTHSHSQHPHQQQQQSWKPDNQNQQDAQMFNDPFITFDSFMAFPGADSFDFSSMSDPQTSRSSTTHAGTTGSASSSVDYLQQPAFNGLGSLEEQNIAAGFPFPVVTGNVDLDAGWNWFGVGAPAM